MTPRERKSLAEQLEANPLTASILSDIEASAIEALIYAKTEQERVEAQWRVKAARAFAEEIKAAIRAT